MKLHLVVFSFVMLTLGTSRCTHAEIIRIATIGDSLTNLYSPKLSGAITAHGGSAIVTKCAQGGLKGATLMTPTDYVDMAIASDPDAVCFLLGINDAYHDSIADASWASFKDNVSIAFDRLQADVNSRGKAPTVIVSTVLPFDVETNQAYWGAAWNNGALNRIENWYRPWLIEQAESRGFIALDLWSEIQQEPNWETTMFGPDGLHFSEFGSDWVSDRFAGAVVSAVPEPTSILMWSLAGACGTMLAFRYRRRLAR